MKDLEKMFDEALDIVKANIGTNELRKIYRPITINYRAKRRWGQCTNSYDGERARIEISSRILADEVPYDATMNVIIHEILHAVKGCSGHTGLWKRLANRITNRTKYAITRCDSAASFGLEEEQQKLMRQYAVKCTCCGKTYYKSKMTKVIKHPEWYRCGICRGSLEREF